MVEGAREHTTGIQPFDRLIDQVRLIHLPVHASWLNQVEFYFSAMQSKALVPNNFRDIDEVEEPLVSFQQYYERDRHAVRVEFTKSDRRTLTPRYEYVTELPGQTT